MNPTWDLHSQPLPMASEDPFSFRLLYAVGVPTISIPVWLFRFPGFTSHLACCLAFALRSLPGLFVRSAAVTSLLCLSSSGAIGLCPGNEGTVHPALWPFSAPGSPLTSESFSCCSLVLSGHHSCQK